MNFQKALVLTLALLISSCTTILVGTTGEQGLIEDPSERTAGAVIEDQSIETRIIVNLKSQETAFRQAHFNVISHNGVVLLVGQVGTDALKARATAIVSQASSKIKRIHNELEVSSNASLLSRGNDTWIATKVRTLMFANSDVPSSQVKVIAENGAIYLMGLINQTQGDAAANIARNVSGVTKVVKVFEYIN